MMTRDAIRLAMVLAAMPLLGSTLPRGFVGPRTAPVELHLYVADYMGGAIYRFPIDKSGMPDPKPDIILNGSLKYPVGLAVNGQGNVFVTDETQTVSEYAVGAHGDAAPIRELTASHAAYFLDVDKKGYLYVENGEFNNVAVFAPGARGNDLPLHSIANWNTHSDSIDAIIVDSQGRLFISTLAGVYIYDDPIGHWQTPSEVFLSEQQPIGPVGGATAVDEVADVFYASFGYGHLNGPWIRADYVKQSIKPTNVGPGPFILTEDCTNGGDFAAAISGDYLLTSCNGDPPSVLVYNKNVFGRQHLVKAIGNFQSPAVIRVGP